MVTVWPDTVALPPVYPTPIRACGLNGYLSEDDALQEYDNDIGDFPEVSVHAKSKDITYNYINNSYTNNTHNDIHNHIDNAKKIYIKY